MAELIGIENGRKYIKNQDKKFIKIFPYREGISGTPIFKSNDPEAAFDDFVSLTDGSSTDEYIILLYDIDTDDEGNRKVGGNRKDRVKITYAFNPKARTSVVSGPAPAAAPVNPTAGLTKQDLIEALKQAAPAPQVDIAAIVGAALEKQSHIHQMETLTNHIKDMKQNFAIELAELKEDMQNELENEEGGIEAARINGEALIAAEKLKLAGIEKIAEFAGPMVKDVVYHFVMGKDSAKGSPGSQLRQVAGPGVAEMATGYKIPVSDKLGELPLHPIDKDGKPLPANAEDQKIKIAYYSQKLYELNDVMGDDLALLYKMSQDMPTKFAEMIYKLRDNV